MPIKVTTSAHRIMGQRSVCSPSSKKPGPIACEEVAWQAEAPAKASLTCDIQIPKAVGAGIRERTDFLSQVIPFELRQILHAPQVIVVGRAALAANGIVVEQRHRLKPLTLRSN